MSLGRLDIRRDNERVRFSLRVGANAGEWVGTWHPEAHQTLQQGLRQLSSSLWSSPWRAPQGAEDAFRNISRALASVVPPEFAGALSRLNKLPLAVASDDTNLPWEWARLGEQFLWQICPIARRGCAPTPPRPGKVLLAVDPENLQPATLEAVGRLHATLQPTVGADLLVSEALTRSAFVNALNSGRYAWVHLACLASLGGDPTLSCLYLADGVITGAQLQQARTAPWQSGFFLSLWDGNSRLHPRPFEPWFTLFQTLGAPTVAGSAWDIPSASVISMTETFYQHLSQGRPAGQCLSAARERLLAPLDPYLGAHSFQIIGDPSWHLAAPAPRPGPPAMRSGLAC